MDTGETEKTVAEIVGDTAKGNTEGGRGTQSEIASLVERACAL